jgi:hypothetical protein
VGLLRKRGSDSLLSVRVWLWEQVSVALLIALELLINTIDIVQVCVIIAFIFVFLSNREVLVIVLKMEIQPLEVLHAHLGRRLGLAVAFLVLDAEAQGEVFYSSHRLRHVEVRPEVARLLVFFGILAVRPVVTFAVLVLSVQTGSKFLLEGLLGILASGLIICVDDGVRRLGPVHGRQTLVCKLKDTALEVLHLLAVLSSVGVQLVDGVRIYCEADVEVLWLRHRLVGILAPIRAYSLPLLLRSEPTVFWRRNSWLEANACFAGKIVGRPLETLSLNAVLYISFLGGSSTLLVLIQTRVLQIEHEVLLQVSCFRELRECWVGRRGI